MSREPALLTSAGRMPERSQHRVSEGQRAPIRPRRIGRRSERPATGHGQPRTVLRRGFFQEHAHPPELLVAFRHEGFGGLVDQASQ